FERAGQVTSYLGLVPQEHSSGEKQRRGRVVRSAQPHLQSLLVQAAWRVSRASGPATGNFCAWGQAIARRGGGEDALGRRAPRLGRRVVAMWRDQRDYQPTRTQKRSPTSVAATIAEASTGAAV